MTTSRSSVLHLQWDAQAVVTALGKGSGEVHW